jgi:hypothetical protein
MRNALIILTVLALTACTDEIEKKDVLPTVPSKRVAVIPAATALKFDTTKASSICKASVRASQKARARLDEAPGDAFAKSKVTTFDALISDACK